MLKKYLVGVDLGTSGTKSALYHINGRKIAEASAEVPIYYPKPGVVEQDDQDFYTTAAQTVKQIVSNSGVDAREIAAIAFDSQMAGVGMIDEDFQPAARFDSWLDMRCQLYIEQMEREAGELVTRLTGCPPTCDHGPKMLWWKQEHPEVYRRVAKFVMPGTYVAGKMAGLRPEQAFIDYTYIHFSGFADSENARWSQVLCHRFGLDMDKLPEIVEPWRVVGEVNEQAAREFGLAPGTPIAAGAGDTAANALGAGIVDAGMLFDVAGTASVLAGCTDRFVADTGHRALLTMRSVIPGLWNPLAYIGGGGIALRWFKDNFYNTSLGETLSSNESLYEVMIEKAAAIPPGADGLFFSPHLGGRICPSSPQMRGAWIGASWSHTQAHFFRAILESIAYEYAYYLGILRELVPDLRMVEARAIGGGARSTAWNQIKADVLGVPYQRLVGNEFGTWRTAHPDGDAIKPDLERHQRYQPLVHKYIQIQEMLNKFFTS